MSVLSCQRPTKHHRVQCSILVIDDAARGGKQLRLKPVYRIFHFAPRGIEKWLQLFPIYFGTKWRCDYCIYFLSRGAGYSSKYRQFVFKLPDGIDEIICATRSVFQHWIYLRRMAGLSELWQKFTKFAYDSVGFKEIFAYDFSLCLVHFVERHNRAWIPTNIHAAFYYFNRPPTTEDLIVKVRHYRCKVKRTSQQYRNSICSDCLCLLPSQRQLKFCDFDLPLRTSESKPSGIKCHASTDHGLISIEPKFSAGESSKADGPHAWIGCLFVESYLAQVRPAQQSNQQKHQRRCAQTQSCVRRHPNSVAFTAGT